MLQGSFGGGGGGGVTLPIAISDVTGLQAALDGKEPTVSLTASRALVSSAGGLLAVSAVTSTELGYVSGVTSAIQTQLGTKITASSSDALTNKTLTSNTNVLGGVTMTLGSDATGDMYYRHTDGTLKRLGVGTSSQVIIGGTVPAWGSVPVTDVTDSTFNIVDNGDTSKKLAFQVSGVSPSTTRTATVPDRNFTLDTLTIGTTGVSGGGNQRILFQTATAITSDSNLIWDSAQQTMGLAGSASGIYKLSLYAGAAPFNGITYSPSYTGSNGMYAFFVTLASTGVGGFSIDRTAVITADTSAGYTSIVSSTSASNVGTNYYATNASTSASSKMLYFVRNSNFTSSNTVIAQIDNNTTGTAAAGFGSVLYYRLESSTTVDQDAAKIVVAWSTATHASRTSIIEFHLVAAASAIAVSHTFGTAYININSSIANYQANGTPVVGLRQTGWTAVSGGTNNRALTAYSNVTFGASYDATVQSQLDALSQAVEDVTNWAKALQADLTTHGLIGT